MLTIKERESINKLSPSLAAKVLSLFDSPVYSSWLAVRKQRDAICEELINSPKKIEGGLSLEEIKGFENQENVDKIIQAISATSRAKSETALKWLKEMKDLVDIEMSLFDMMRPDEQKSALSVSSARDLRSEALQNE